jgi:hypothetical protein
LHKIFSFYFGFIYKIFTSKTAGATLNEALKRIHKNKSELLLVLERPDIPLHKNSAENTIREYVKKRKINGSTQSKLGRRARDTFTSLKKTCRKPGLSFWQYLRDRIENAGIFPALSRLIKEQAIKPEKRLKHSKGFSDTSSDIPIPDGYQGYYRLYSNDLRSRQALPIF